MRQSPAFHAVPASAAILALLVAAPLFAAEHGIDPHDAAVLASTCASCHGPEGRSPGAIPSLAGRPADELRSRMLTFKSGGDPSATVMPRHMAGYDEAQIDALAQWFSEVGP